MLTFYDWTGSPNCLKTRIVLSELGLEYRELVVDRSVLQSADFRAKFPTGQAPAIEDGDLRISESSAIALYLAEKAKALIPMDSKRRALMYQALALESALLAPTVGGQGLFGELFRPEAERNLMRVAELRVKAQHVARVLGAVLGDRAYFAGEYTIADIQLYAATAKSIEGGVFDETPPNLLAWWTRMTERPSVAKAREKYIHYARVKAA